jgi:hypothetical protein
VWAPTGVDESVVQPAADEGDPSLAVGSSLGDEAEAGSGSVVVFHPSLRNGVGSNCKRAGLGPRLRFVPRFLLAFLLWPPKVTYG